MKFARKQIRKMENFFILMDCVSILERCYSKQMRVVCDKVKFL